MASESFQSTMLPRGTPWYHRCSMAHRTPMPHCNAAWADASPNVTFGVQYGVTPYFTVKAMAAHACSLLPKQHDVPMPNSQVHKPTACGPTPFHTPKDHVHILMTTTPHRPTCATRRRWTVWQCEAWEGVGRRPLRSLTVPPLVILCRSAPGVLTASLRSPK